MLRPASTAAPGSGPLLKLRTARRWYQQVGWWLDAAKLTFLIVGGTIASFVEGHYLVGLTVLAILGTVALLIRRARRSPAGQGLQRELPAVLALPIAFLFSAAIFVAIIAATR